MVLLHGLARTEKSLLKLERHLESDGFCVVNTGYPSREKTIQELSVDVIPAAIEQCKGDPVVSKILRKYKPAYRVGWNTLRFQLPGAFGICDFVKTKYKNHAPTQNPPKILPVSCIMSVFLDMVHKTRNNHLAMNTLQICQADGLATKPKKKGD